MQSCKKGLPPKSAPWMLLRFFDDLRTLPFASQEKAAGIEKLGLVQASRPVVAVPVER